MRNGRHHLRDAVLILSFFAGLITYFGTCLLFDWRWEALSFLLGVVVVLLFLPLVRVLHIRAETARAARLAPGVRPAARSLPLAIFVVTLVVAVSFLALAAGTYAYFAGRCDADGDSMCYEAMIALAPVYGAVGSLVFGTIDAGVLALLRFLRPAPPGKDVPLPRAEVRPLSGTRPSRHDRPGDPTPLASGPRAPALHDPEA